MTSPDQQGLPDPKNGWDGVGIDGLGDFLLGTFVLRPLSVLLSWISGRPAEDFDTTDELRTEFFNWIDNIPLIGPLVQMITGVVGPLQNIGKFFQDLVGRALQGLNPLSGLFSGLQNVFFHTTSVKNTADAAAASATQASSTVVNVTNQVNYIAEVVNVKAGRSFSESGPDPTADPSFDYENIGRDGVASITSATARGAVVRMGGASRKRGLSYMARISSGSITGFYLNLYKMDPDGTWRYLQTTPDQSGFLGGGMAFGLVNVPEEFLVDLGETFGVEYVVTGSGTVEVPVNIVQPHLPYSSIVPLARGWSRSTSTNPSVFTPAAMAPLYTETIPWVGIGVDLNASPPSRTFTDNFNYNTATLFQNFQVFSTPGGDGNAPQIEGNAFSYNRSTGNDGYALGTYLQPLISDNWFCEVRLGGLNDRPCGLYVGAANGTGTMFLFDTVVGIRYIRTYYDGYRKIRTGGVRGPSGQGVPAGVYRLERQVNPANPNSTATIVAFRNGVEIDRFVDTETWIQYGPGNRYFGPAASRFSFGTSFNPDDLAFGDIPLAAAA